MEYKMKDDLWVAEYTAELVYNILLRGSLPMNDIIACEEREEEIKGFFLRRFGSRGQILLDKIYKEINRI